MLSSHETKHPRCCCCHLVKPKTTTTSFIGWSRDPWTHDTSLPVSLITSLLLYTTAAARPSSSRSCCCCSAVGVAPPGLLVDQLGSAHLIHLHTTVAGDRSLPPGVTHPSLSCCAYPGGLIPASKLYKRLTDVRKRSSCAVVIICQRGASRDSGHLI